ncbi:MAG: hypothetical protein HYY52_07390 [Candidatus Melainabacteria bacterium]|nr:hypothetical protein [Candidatus Melainabacteria bacterium]
MTNPVSNNSPVSYGRKVTPPGDGPGGEEAQSATHSSKVEETSLLEQGGTTYVGLIPSHIADSEVKFSSREVFIDRLANAQAGGFTGDLRNHDSPIDAVSGGQLTAVIFLYLKDKSDRGEDISVELSKLPPAISEIFPRINSIEQFDSLLSELSIIEPPTAISGACPRGG